MLICFFSVSMHQNIFSWFRANHFQGWDLINQVNPAFFVCMLHVRTWISNVICRSLFCVQWVKVRGDSTLCWYWWNCRPSMLKFFFHNCVCSLIILLLSLPIENISLTSSPYPPTVRLISILTSIFSSADCSPFSISSRALKASLVSTRSCTILTRTLAQIPLSVWRYTKEENDVFKLKIFKITES